MLFLETKSSQRHFGGAQGEGEEEDAGANLAAPGVRRAHGVRLQRDGDVDGSVRRSRRPPYGGPPVVRERRGDRRSGRRPPPRMTLSIRE